jgi:hypothetical protein
VADTVCPRSTAELAGLYGDRSGPAPELWHIGRALAEEPPGAGALARIDGDLLLHVGAGTPARLPADRRARVDAIRARVDPDGLFATDYATA